MPDRAMVALSDDRRFGCELGEVTGDWFCWDMEDEEEDPPPYLVPDTGQDAHKVLREFLEGR